jgi:ABC-type polysaccharide/polyol phosphate export permease
MHILRVQKKECNFKILLSQQTIINLTEFIFKNMLIFIILKMSYYIPSVNWLIFGLAFGIFILFRRHQTYTTD